MQRFMSTPHDYLHPVGITAGASAAAAHLFASIA